MAEEITRDSIQIARLEEQFSAIRKDMDEMGVQMHAMQEQLAEVLEKLSEAKGGWRVLMLLGGAAAGVGASLSWFLQHVRVQ